MDSRAFATLIGSPWKIVIAFRLLGLPGPEQTDVPAKANCPLEEPSRGVAEEVETEQRMVIEHAIRCAHHGFAVAVRIPATPMRGWKLFLSV